MVEEWRDIPGYENKYQVSNLGRIKSIYKNNKTIIKKSTVDTYGYFIVGLWKYGKRKTFKTHRLVAQAFIPNPNNYPQVNHKDENKLNNNVDNLEWCTEAYNNIYGSRMKKIQKKVVQYDLNGNFIKEWESINSAIRALGITTISRCCKGKGKTAGGYIWRYWLE